jgi:hypothetical protein
MIVKGWSGSDSTVDGDVDRLEIALDDGTGRMIVIEGWEEGQGFDIQVEDDDDTLAGRHLVTISTRRHTHELGELLSRRPDGPRDGNNPQTGIAYSS